MSSERIQPQFDSPLYRKCDDDKCEYRYAFAEYGLPHYHYLGWDEPD